MRGLSNARGVAFWAGVVTIGALACAVATTATPREAKAQISNSDYWLYQPHESTPVGRAWCNADRSVEYWAYVVGEYEFADATNIPANPWHLEAQRVGGTNYAGFAAFKAAVLALPAMAGKTILFQSHVVSEETVEN